MGGTKYAVECVVIMSLDYGICNFGLVDKILVVEDTVIFQCKKLKIVKYGDHLKSYQVSLSEDLQYISQKKLVDFHPLSLNEGLGVNSGKNYVTLHYKVNCILLSLWLHNSRYCTIFNCIHRRGNIVSNYILYTSTMNCLKILSWYICKCMMLCLNTLYRAHCYLMQLFLQLSMQF